MAALDQKEAGATGIKEQEDKNTTNDSGEITSSTLLPKSTEE
jgi:hypothetical protein